jgi:aspartokinase/homoserine dehydrogenase 1
MPEDSLVVHKFGGTSVAGADRYRHVARIVAARPERRRAVVVSAMRGVTDTLLHAVSLARARDEGYRGVVCEVRRRHEAVLDELFGAEGAAPLREALRAETEDVLDVLRAAWLLRSTPRSARDLAAGYGEVWSARTLAAVLARAGTPAAWLDARDVVVAQPDGAGAVVDWQASRERMRAWLAARPDTPETLVVTGFVASTREGVATTLGRNGSDFSASIFAALLGAAEIHIWTDVDGVMSADPRLVPEAQPLPALSYREAMELAYFGAKVIHPGTMAPAVERGIPIYIRNTFHSEAPGTRIDAAGSPRADVKGFTTIAPVALVNVEGTGMIGVPGTAHRLFGALREKGISVIMISQGSSEHSICFAVPAADADAARAAVEEAFFAERAQGRIQTVDVLPECCVLAIVGDGMAGHPGTAASFFGALGKAGINIRAIAQGSSERNISVVLDRADERRALRAVHAGFYLSDQTLSVGIIGTGTVGSALLEQLASQARRLRVESRVDLRVRGLATSRRMLLHPRGAALEDWRGALAEGGVPMDLDAFVDHVQTDALPHTVLIDCTASEEVARRYQGWPERGIHVITPNKRANAGSLDYYRGLWTAMRGSHMHYLYETTVGAGLPIVQTLRDLVNTGDEVRRIEGVLSGTLSYLFQAFDGTRPFSQVLAEARAKGYTEPDPRDDLSGMDVARKVVILGREMGLPVELADVRVESLVPEPLRAGGVDDFMAALPAHDAEIGAVLDDARRRGKVLRYVGEVSRDGAFARLQALDASHPFARIRPTDNIVQFHTRRYDVNPLVVQGPGAGPDVTAGGIFADLLRLASYLGATL